MFSPNSPLPVQFESLLFVRKGLLFLSQLPRKFTFPLFTPNSDKPHPQLFKLCILPLLSGFEDGFATVNGGFTVLYFSSFNYFG